VDNLSIPPGSVVITPTELYKEMQLTHQAVTEMRGDLKKVTEVMPDHETRIRALERRIWLAAGVAAGAAAGITKALSAVLGG
jgi:hypothetical protein